MNYYITKNNEDQRSQSYTDLALNPITKAIDSVITSRCEMSEQMA